MNLNYNFVDFSGGYGASSMAEVDELNKALEAGAGYEGAPTSLTGGGALQVESLDASLKSVTYETKHIKMWGQIAKDQAYNTIEEYNRTNAFGDQGRGFISEGALPRSEDAAYSRHVQRVRFIGVTREITHVYSLVRNAHGDAMAREIRNGTLRILEIAERALHDGRGFYSNAGVFDGQAAILDADLSWEGFDIQIRKGDADATAQAQAFTNFGLPSAITDLKGAILDEDVLEEVANGVQENVGIPSLLEMDTKSHSDLSKQFYPKERINQMGVQNGRAGFVLREFDSSAGTFALQSNLFIRPKRGVGAALADGPAAPGALTPAVAADANSELDAGTYEYVATAINSAGEGVASASAAQVVAAGEKVTVTIPATAGAIAYAVYRKDPGASAHEFVGYVAPAAVGAAVDFTDLNKKRAGLSQAYMFSMDPEVLRFKQLAPLMKMDLAIIATAYRWMQLLYGTPIVYAPRKCALMENIGRA